MSPRKAAKLTWILLRVVRPLLVREMTRLADEKDNLRDAHHYNGDCGFQLLHELGWRMSK